MILDDIDIKPRITYVRCICDDCKKEFTKTRRSIIKHMRLGIAGEFCKSCECKRSAYKKPQCTKGYWDNLKKLEHSKSIKSSISYYTAIKNRITSGDRNSMYGKKHTIATLDKMSKVRKGRKYSKEHIDNIRKGLLLSWSKREKKSSLSQQIRGYIHREIHWYQRIYARDGYRCTDCSKTSSECRLDAHHIIPLSILLKEHDERFNLVGASNSDKFKSYIEDPLITDNELKNGITLCRECHAKRHIWGSHNALRARKSNEK